MPFQHFRLHAPLLRAVKKQGYAAPTDIQHQAIPHVIEGRDVLGCAQTGTGKTAAFALPILHRLQHLDADGNLVAPAGDNGDNGNHQGQTDAPRRQRNRGRGRGRTQPRGPRRPIRALVISPTRELAAQIGESFHEYGRYTGLRHTVVFGGVSQMPQVKALRDGVDILVATPGRLLDLLNQGVMTLDKIECFVLDEADRMLDMGFMPDVRKLVELIPRERQTLMFSATMPPEIQKLADQLLVHPVEVKIEAKSAAADTVEQFVYFVERARKVGLLGDMLLNEPMGRTLVFSRTKHGADKIAVKLNRMEIRADTIHSNKSQTARQRSLRDFKIGKTQVLVATDIAARGIDVDNISHVINFDMPGDAETYVHRIGRTGRAGEEGVAYSFCTREELGELQDVERLLGRRLQVARHDFEPREPIESLPLNKPRPNGRAPKNGYGGNKSRSGPKRSRGRKPEHPLHKTSQSKRQGAGVQSRTKSRSRKPPR